MTVVVVALQDTKNLMSVIDTISTKVNKTSSVLRTVNYDLKPYKIKRKTFPVSIHSSNAQFKDWSIQTLEEEMNNEVTKFTKINWEQTLKRNAHPKWKIGLDNTPKRTIKSKVIPLNNDIAKKLKEIKNNSLK